MKLLLCPKCEESSELSYLGSILLPFDLQNDDSLLCCPECKEESRKGDVTLMFTGVTHG